MRLHSAVSPGSGVVVIGGANVDGKSRLHAPPVFGTSNPGTTTASFGGVARNVAENLARLGVAAHLISAVGEDEFGTRLLDHAHACGIDTTPVIRTAGPTGSYTAILDSGGELILAVASMGIMDALTPDVVGERRTLLERARAVVVDCNVPGDTLAFVAEVAREAGVPCLVEPVSVPKAARLRALLDIGIPVHTVTPNLAELAALTSHDVRGDEGLEAAIDELHGRGVGAVWVRLGPEGSMLSDGHGLRRHPALPAAVRDVTGAGDAMLAGYVYALLQEHDSHSAARRGHALAALTVESDFTVLPSLTPALLEARVQGVS